MSNFTVTYTGTRSVVLSFVGFSSNTTFHSDTYKITDMCEAPANDPVNWRDPGFIHTVIVDKLFAATCYAYSVGSKTDGYSQRNTFCTAPPVGKRISSDRPITFIQFG